MPDTAAGIPYEGTDCTADEAVEAVKAVRATAATKRDKRFGYIVTAVDGDLSVLPKNLTVGTILIEKRGRGRFTQWDFVNMETGAFAYVAGRKIGVGYAVDGKIEWVGGTPPEAKP